MSLAIVGYIALAVTTFTVLWHLKIKFSPEFRGMQKVDTLRSLPVIGHAPFFENKPDKLLPQIYQAAIAFKKKYANATKGLVWMMPFSPIVLIFEAKGCKEIFMDKSWNDKSFLQAKFFKSWLGTGAQ